MVIMFSTFIAGTFLISLTKSNTLINNRINSNVILFFFVMFAGYKIALIESNGVDDLYIYGREFINYHYMTFFDALTTSNKELLFTILQWSLAQISLSLSFFYVCIWIIFAVIFLQALKNLFLPWQVLIVFFCYMNYFIFFRYLLTAMRQGFALTLLLLAVTILITKKKKNILFYISIAAAPLFHLSSLPLSILFLVLKKIEFKLKTVLVMWGVSSLLFITNINSLLLSKLNNPIIQAYSSDLTLIRYSGGTNRIDFLLFSAIWIVFGLLISMKIKISDNAKKLFKIYIIFNTYFLLLGFVAFSDRIASYSWFLVPFIIWEFIFKSELKHKLLITFITLVTFLGTGLYLGSLNTILH